MSILSLWGRILESLHYMEMVSGQLWDIQAMATTGAYIQKEQTPRWKHYKYLLTN
jgi:hypothetical protein